MSEAAADFYHALMWAGSWWCHQLPARSPHFWGAQLPLCWRCTGIAAGAVLLLLWLIKKKRLPALSLSLMLATLLPLDVLQAVITYGPGHNARRLITGVLWGVFGTSLMLHLIKYRHARRGQSFKPQRPIWSAHQDTERAGASPSSRPLR